MNQDDFPRPRPNPNKLLIKIVDNQIYARYPIKTRLISSRDRLDDIIRQYATPYLREGDLLAISERMVAITQGRSFLIKDIHPSWWAKVLCRFVTKHPGGIGLKSPYTMQLAIDEAGLPRILLAAGLSAVTRPWGIKGWFYQVVGGNVNAIDGPCEYTLPPGNQSAKLGPREPRKTAQRLATVFKVGVAIIDANDYGVRVLGASSGVKKRLMEQVFSDNPLGQSDEQTPLAIIRKISPVVQKPRPTEASFAEGSANNGQTDR